MKYIKLDGIIFNRIIESGSSYGVIWVANHQKYGTCIIKMLSLNTGTHYDKDTDTYFDKHRVKIDRSNALELYRTTSIAPFLHREFIQKRSVTLDNFQYELSQYIQLSKLNLAPVIYDYGVSHTIAGFKYGFIVMEKIQSNVKNIREVRHLTKDEKELISKTITRLHDNGYVHGDLKPNNIGVKLSDDLHRIESCVFFDCYTVRQLSEFSDEDKIRKMKKDFFVYDHYYKKIKTK